MVGRDQIMCDEPHTTEERALPSAMVGVRRSTKSHLSGGLVAGPQDVLAGRADRSVRRSGRGYSESCRVHARFVGWIAGKEDNRMLDARRLQ